jgi:uncharacterized membrane protein YfcA
LTAVLALTLVAVSVLAGVFGALLGIGGGILLIPILHLIFHISTHAAMGASLVSVIATSSGAAVAYVRDHMSNLRIGMFLEIATTTGAVSGAFLAAHIGVSWLNIIFGLVLAFSTFSMLQRHGQELPEGVHPHPWAKRLHLGSTYHDDRLGKDVTYEVAGVPAGLGMMYVAGLLSGLLGIGSGVFKVLGMDVFMKLPFKVSSSTSNFMIGVTAAASAGFYFAKGWIHPGVSAPVAIGVLIGALMGARIMVRLRSRTLRLVFVPILLAAAAEMLLSGLGVRGV